MGGAKIIASVYILAMWTGIPLDSKLQADLKNGLKKYHPSNIAKAYIVIFRFRVNDNTNV